MRALIGIEIELAYILSTEVELRDPIKPYNKVNLADLDKPASNYGRKSWLDTTDREIDKLGKPIDRDG